MFNVGKNFLFDFTLRYNSRKSKLTRAKLQRTRDSGCCIEDRQRRSRNYDAAALHTFAHLENREERENTDASRAFIGSYELILLQRKASPSSATSSSLASPSSDIVIVYSLVDPTPRAKASLLRNGQEVPFVYVIRSPRNSRRTVRQFCNEFTAHFLPFIRQIRDKFSTKFRIYSFCKGYSLNFRKKGKGIIAIINL